MSHAQRSLPVTASNPSITPEGASLYWPSRIWWPTTTTPRTMVGAELIEARPGKTSPMPVLVSAWPAVPKPGHGVPASASTAIRRESSVPSMMRWAQGVFAAALGTA